LAHEEGCTAGGATLLGVVVGEYHSFFGNTINVGRLVAHQAFGVGADVALPDVITPDDDDIRFLGGCRWVDSPRHGNEHSKHKQYKFLFRHLNLLCYLWVYIQFHLSSFSVNRYQ